MWPKIVSSFLVSVLHLQINFKFLGFVQKQFDRFVMLIFASQYESRVASSICIVQGDLVLLALFNQDLNHFVPETTIVSYLIIIVSCLFTYLFSEQANKNPLYPTLSVAWMLIL